MKRANIRVNVTNKGVTDYPYFTIDVEMDNGICLLYMFSDRRFSTECIIDAVIELWNTDDGIGYDYFDMSRSMKDALSKKSIEIFEKNESLKKKHSDLLSNDKTMATFNVSFNDDNNIIGYHRI